MAHGPDDAAAEAVVRLLIALHEARRRAAREEHGARDDQRVLKLLADSLPVRRVREEPLVRLEILLSLMSFGSASVALAVRIDGVAPDVDIVRRIGRRDLALLFDARR